MIGRIDIEAAWTRIAARVRETPVIELAGGTFERLAAPLTLKLECLQVAGSFKPRGAFSRMLGVPVPKSGVIAASGGNHGIAVAHAAKTLGHRAEIFAAIRAVHAGGSLLQPVVAARVLEHVASRARGGDALPAEEVAKYTVGVDDYHKIG